MPDNDLIRIRELLWTETDVMTRKTYNKLISELEETLDAPFLSLMYGRQIETVWHDRDFEKAVAYFVQACKWYSQITEDPGIQIDFFLKAMKTELQTFQAKKNMFDAAVNAGKYTN
ncbi:MAG: hypothetical protein KAT77_03780 [Nanoarchaeota archaeon]|nr:hypothetical protein [Nanoarchaeota archaeon]